MNQLLLAILGCFGTAGFSWLAIFDIKNNKDLSLEWKRISKLSNFSKMDACDVVERDVEKVTEKFHVLGDSNHQNLNEAIQLVRAARDEIRDCKPKETFFLFPNIYCSNFRHRS